VHERRRKSFVLSFKAGHTLTIKATRAWNGLVVLGHLEDVGMGYFEHMKGALVLSIRFGLSSIQLILHALFPFIFIDAGKRAAEKYNGRHR